MTALTDCRFCGSEIGARDQICGACGKAQRYVGCDECCVLDEAAMDAQFSQAGSPQTGSGASAMTVPCVGQPQVRIGTALAESILVAAWVEEGLR